MINDYEREQMRREREPHQKVFQLSEGCAIIEWWDDGKLYHVSVSDLRHTRLSEEGLPE